MTRAELLGTQGNVCLDVLCERYQQRTVERGRRAYNSVQSAESQERKCVVSNMGCCWCVSVTRSKGEAHPVPLGQQKFRQGGQKSM
jgi:hypothetical protein